MATVDQVFFVMHNELGILPLNILRIAATQQAGSFILLLGDPHA